MYMSAYVHVCVYTYIYLHNYTASGLSSVPISPDVKRLFLQFPSELRVQRGSFPGVSAASARMVILSLIIPVWSMQASHFNSPSPPSHCITYFHAHYTPAESAKMT